MSVISGIVSRVANEEDLTGNRELILRLYHI